MNLQKFYASDAIVYGLKETFNNLRVAFYSMSIIICEILASILIVGLPTITFAIWQMPELRALAIQVRVALSTGSYATIQTIFKEVAISQVPLSVIIVCSLALCALFVLGSMFSSGYIRMLLKFHDTGVANLRDMFMGWHRGPRLLLAGIIFALSVLAGLILFIIPGIYIFAHGILFPFFIVDKNVGIIESFKRSFNAVHGYSWHIGALILLIYIFNINPSLYFLTGFTKVLMLVYAYRRLTA